MSNPLLEPVHGVSLYDYAAVCAKTAAGIPEEEIIKALGLEEAVYEEASALWITRMQQDSSFEVATLFGKYFGEADNHPKLSGLQTEISEDGKANLEKMKTDQYFFEELNGARKAAYDYGYDGAQWIQDNFGINLTDFQTVAMQWNPAYHSEDFDTIKHFLDYRQQKEKEYAARFATEQGGNVADDVEF